MFCGGAGRKTPSCACAKPRKSTQKTKIKLAMLDQNDQQTSS